MRSWAKTLFGSIFVFSIIHSNLITNPTVLSQGVSDFVITKFSAYYKLNNDDPQGRLYVTETIDLVFSGQNQGIERAIPMSYRDNDLKLKVVSATRDGKTDPFTTYESSDNQVVRIGVREIFITGAHSYEIKYEVSNVVSFYEDYDEFYWDINGDQWLQPFESVTLDMMTDAPRKETIAPECFTGGFGSNAKNCSIELKAGGLIAGTTVSLRPNETLTVVQAYAKGYFAPPGWAETNRHLLFSLPFIIVTLLLVLNAYKKWQKLGRDYEKRGVIAPYFERPKNLSVMQASYVESNNLTPKHVSASMIDLAIRGYIQIVETGEGRSVKHQLVLKNIDMNHLSLDEQQLLKALFKGFTVNETVTIEKLKNKLHTTQTVLKKEIDNAMTAKGFYEISPQKSARHLYLPLVISVVTLFASFFTGGVTKGVGIGVSVVGLLVIIIFMSLMAKRSRDGNLLVEHMQGLKLYLSFSEKDRIKSQDAVAAPLSPSSGEPNRDVKFFEKLLPFAVAMGVEKTWANAFKDIYTQPPDWYQGNWNTFTTAALVFSLASTSAATASSFSAPTTSGGSGSGGGGFSGGGGGGGGGGGW